MDIIFRPTFVTAVWVLAYDGDHNVLWSWDEMAWYSPVMAAGARGMRWHSTWTTDKSQAQRYKQMLNVSDQYRDQVVQPRGYWLLPNSLKRE